MSRKSFDELSKKRKRAYARCILSGENNVQENPERLRLGDPDVPANPVAADIVEIEPNDRELVEPGHEGFPHIDIDNNEGEILMDGNERCGSVVPDQEEDNLVDEIRSEISFEDANNHDNASEDGDDSLLDVNEEEEIVEAANDNVEGEEEAMEDAEDIENPENVDDENDEEGDEEDDEEYDEEDDEEHDEEDDEEHDEDEEENFDDRFDGNQLLYADAPLSISQSMLLILTLVITHNVNQSCLADFIAVLNLHCIGDRLFRNSLYKFRKFFSFDKEKCFVKHYYCSVCLDSLQSIEDDCNKCQERSKKSYFIEMPFLKQLKELLKREGFYDQLQHRFRRQNVRPGDITDIYDGCLYKNLTDCGFLSNPNNISLTWYTDGVPVFKSSKISIWPMYFTINELPFKERTKRENVMLAGLWFGNTKPNANNFVHTLRPELKKLFDGRNFTLPDGRNITVRGTLLLGTCDLMAKYQFLNLAQFNSEYGCPTCYCKGERFRISDKAGTRIYRHEENPVLRTSEETVRHADAALLRQEPVMGVKGPCAFSKLMPDFIVGTALDRMHGIDAGVVKALLSFWFDSAYRHLPFSLLDVIGVINERLSALKPPNFVHRMPRSVEHLVHWKASELRMWFFYYSVPILSGIMRPDFFQHYLLLVVGVSLLNDDCITPSMIDKASNLLTRFSREFPDKYGLRHCSMNMHQITHLVDKVKSLGPLWAYTCYRFEDLNGQFLNLIHGTWHVETQIANSQWQLLQMRKHLDALPQGEIRDFCFGRRQHVKLCEKIEDHCYSVGTYKVIRDLPHFIERAVIQRGIQYDNLYKYFRLLKNGKLHVSEEYLRSTKTSSSYILYKESDVFHFASIHYFLKVTTDCHCENECQCETKHYAIVQRLDNQGTHIALGDNEQRVQIPHICKCRRVNEFACIPVQSIARMLVHMRVDNQSYVGVPINDKELE